MAGLESESCCVREGPRLMSTLLGNWERIYEETRVLDTDVCLWFSACVLY